AAEDAEVGGERQLASDIGRARTLGHGDVTETGGGVQARRIDHLTCAHEAPFSRDRSCARGRVKVHPAPPRVSSLTAPPVTVRVPSRGVSEVTPAASCNRAPPKRTVSAWSYDWRDGPEAS